MPEKWTGQLIGKMHNAQVTLADLAQELGVSVPYVSMMLNGKRTPDGAKERLNNAFNACVQRKKEEN